MFAGTSSQIKELATTSNWTRVAISM